MYGKQEVCEQKGGMMEEGIKWESFQILNSAAVGSVSRDKWQLVLVKGVEWMSR